MTPKKKPYKYIKMYGLELLNRKDKKMANENITNLDKEEFEKTLDEIEQKHLEDYKKMLEANGYRVTKI